MLNIDRSRQVLEISLPIVGGMVSQNVLNLVDAAMVGTQGSAAIAAIGISGFINFMAVAFLLALLRVCRPWCRVALAKVVAKKRRTL